MLKKLFRYLFGSILEELRDEIKREARGTQDAAMAEIDKRLREDMAHEMQRVGLAMLATNRQVMLLKSSTNLMKMDVDLVKAGHECIVELAKQITEPIAPRPSGQVDWEPTPAHFGNKIDLKMGR